MRKVTAVLSTVLVLAAMPFAVCAEEPGFERQMGRLLLTSINHSLELHVPTWGQGAGGSDASQLQLVRTSGGPTVEVLELIPSSESIDAWTRMLAAMVVAQPGYDTPTLEYSISAAFQQGCTPDTLSLGIAKPANGNLPRVLYAVCGRYADGLTGTVTGQGEVLIATVYQTEKGAVKVYQEWRGPAFDPREPAQWPVDSTELDWSIEALQAVTRVSAQ